MITGLTWFSCRPALCFRLITPIETRTRASDLGRSHHGNVPPSLGVLLVSSTLLQRLDRETLLPGGFGITLARKRTSTCLRQEVPSRLNRVKIKSKPNLICLGLVMSPHGWAELPPLEVGCVSFFMASSQALLTEGAQNSSTRWARGERIFGRFMGPCGPLLVLQWTESMGSSKLEHIHI